MVFDPIYLNSDMSVFKTCDWKESYEQGAEALPLSATPSLVKEVYLRLCVDSDHTGDKLRDSLVQA